MLNQRIRLKIHAMLILLHRVRLPNYLSLMASNWFCSSSLALRFSVWPCLQRAWGSWRRPSGHTNRLNITWLFAQDCFPISFNICFIQYQTKDGEAVLVNMIGFLFVLFATGVIFLLNKFSKDQNTEAAARPRTATWDGLETDMWHFSYQSDMT